MIIVITIRILDNICCSRTYIKCLPYALTEKAVWDSLDEQDTKHNCLDQWSPSFSKSEHSRSPKKNYVHTRQLRKNFFDTKTTIFMI